MRGAFLGLAVALTGILPVLTPGPARSAEDLLSRGREVSQKQCSRCHVIGDFNPTGGISSTPSFQMIVNALPDWQERFSTFYTRRPHPAAVEIRNAPPLTQSMATMVRLVIDIEDVKAITVFAGSLRK